MLHLTTQLSSNVYCQEFEGSSGQEHQNLCNWRADINPPSTVPSTIISTREPDIVIVNVLYKTLMYLNGQSLQIQSQTSQKQDQGNRTNKITII